MTKGQEFAGPAELGGVEARVFIEWRALTCPKAEYTAETTEDRYAQRAAAGLFAVADGVGASYRAAEWAQAVVESWARSPFHSQDAFEVEGWLRKLQPRFALRPEEIAALQPYAQNLARQGAGCTFLGLRLWPARDGRSALYALLCVGDSVMIHYDVTVYPIFSPNQFGSYPTVLRSRGYDREREPVQRYPNVVRPDDGLTQDAYQRLSPGETLLLCTDALAHWALAADNAARGSEEGARLQLERQTPETWPNFIAGLRRAGKIVDDDTTAVFIRIAEDQTAPAGSAPNVKGWRRVELASASIAPIEAGWQEARRLELAEALGRVPLSAIEVARAYGDGWFVRDDHAANIAITGRKLAGELEKINAALRAVNWDQPTRAQLDAVAGLRRRYGEALRDEPAAQGALATIGDLLGGARITQPLDSDVPITRKLDSGAPITRKLDADEAGAEQAGSELERRS